MLRPTLSEIPTFCTTIRSSGSILIAYRMTVSQANALQSQARRTFRGVVLSKLRRSIGSPYGQSIANSVQSFYANLARSIDGRLSPNFGREIVRTCIEIGRKAAVQRPFQRTGTGVIRCNSESGGTGGLELARRSWFLGATGFIGQELARQLIARDIPIRVLGP